MAALCCQLYVRSYFWFPLLTLCKKLFLVHPPHPVQCEAKWRIQLKSLYFYEHLDTTFEAFFTFSMFLFLFLFLWWICVFKFFWKPSFIFSTLYRTIKQRISYSLFSVEERLILLIDYISSKSHRLKIDLGRPVQPCLAQSRCISMWMMLEAAWAAWL